MAVGRRRPGLPSAQQFVGAGQYVTAVLATVAAPVTGDAGPVEVFLHGPRWEV